MYEAVKNKSFLSIKKNNKLDNLTYIKYQLRFSKIKCI